MDELIKNALNGDKDSYTTLIISIQSDMYRVACARLNDIDDINDAIQETILKSYDKLNTLKEVKYFKTWIIRILINECNLIYRNKKRQLGLFNKIVKADNVSNFTTNFQNIDNNIDFDILISKLNYNERIILTLYFKNKYSLTDISYILGINVNTIKTKLSRAKGKLKKLYEEGGLKNETRK